MSTPNPLDNTDDIKHAILAGDKIRAIKLYRERTNVGLAEAKSAVEQMEVQLGGSASADITLPKTTPASPLQTTAITEALFAGKKIAAIKLYREQTKTSLAGAKRAVEEIEAQLRVSSPGLFAKPAGKGCLAMLVLTGCIGLALWKALA